MCRCVRCGRMYEEEDNSYQTPICQECKQILINKYKKSLRRYRLFQVLRFFIIFVYASSWLMLFKQSNIVGILLFVVLSMIGLLLVKIDK